MRVGATSAEVIRQVEAQLAGDTIRTGVLYDTLEAPKTARLRPAFPDEAQGAEERGVEPIDNTVKETLTRLYIRRVLEAVRGGAWWLDIPGLTDSILSGKVSLSRRFWYNQIAADEDSWVHPDAIDAAVHPYVAELRRAGVPADLAYGDRGMKGAMKAADRSGASYAVVLGDRDLEAGEAQLKDLRSHEQSAVPLTDLVSTLKGKLL